MTSVPDTSASPPTRIGGIPTPILIDTAVVAVLGIIGMVGFGTAFDSSEYLLAGIGGLFVGALAALVAFRLGFGPLLTAAVALVAYYLLGSPIAFTGSALFGFLPNLTTLSNLTIGPVFGWADLITLRAPVSLPDYVTAVPYVSGWLVALVSVTLAARWLPRRRRTAARASVLLIGPALLYIAGVLLGTDEPYFAGARGIAFAALALVWLGWRRRDGGAIAIEGARALLRRKIIGTAAVVLAAVVTGAVVGTAIAPPAESRFVLREKVEPPFEPLAYPSPLAGFRKYTKDLEDTTIFSVTGLRAGEKIRLASMDTYNGVIWGVAGAEQASDASGSFRLVGRTIPAPTFLTSSQDTSLSISIDAYNDVWVPDAGYADELTFTDPVGKQNVENVRYNEATGTAVVTSGLSKGGSYTLDAALQEIPEDKALEKVPVASFPAGTVSNTPDQVVAKAAEVTADENSPIGKLRAIEQYLITTGFLSHGTASDQVPSRAGHGADRMFDMVTKPTMVGDEEQYSSLFALMARSLGYPVRVVMGFDPELAEDSTGAVKISGKNVTAWAEVAFEGVGWVPFNPTPDETDVPQDQVPKPQTEPQPQVRQPPRTDNEQDDLVTAVEIDENKDDENTLLGLPTWIVVVGIILAVPLILVVLPLLLIAAAKRRRMRRRRDAASGYASVAGAWDEVLDRYSELGYTVPTRTTRVHVASGLQEQLSGQPTGLRELAREADTAVFSGREIGAEDSKRVWTEAMAAVAAAQSAASTTRRLLALFRVSAARRWAARLTATAAAEASKSRAPGASRTTTTKLKLRKAKK